MTFTLNGNGINAKHVNISCANHKTFIKYEKSWLAFFFVGLSDLHVFVVLNICPESKHI